MASTPQLILSNVLGIAAGILAIYAFGGLPNRKDAQGVVAAPVETRARSVPEEKNASGGTSWDEDRVRKLERDLAAVARTSASAPSHPPPEVQPRPSLQESIVQAQIDFDVMMSAHRLESADPVWAKSAAASLDEDLRTFADKSGFAVKEVDCRTTSCAATLEWKSFTEARAAMGTLAHKSYRANCARTIYMPGPDDESQPYESTVVFDCTNARMEK